MKKKHFFSGYLCTFVFSKAPISGWQSVIFPGRHLVLWIWEVNIHYLMKESSTTASPFLTAALFLSHTHSNTRLSLQSSGLFLTVTSKQMVWDLRRTLTEGERETHSPAHLEFTWQLKFWGVRKLVKCETHKKSAYTHFEGGIEHFFPNHKKEKNTEIFLIFQLFLDKISIISVLIIIVFIKILN